VGGVWGRVLSVGALLNAFLAVFNLVPFGVLDGYKIFSWDKKVWVALFGVSLLLLIYLF
jgi:Zn-dependent protease